MNARTVPVILQLSARMYLEVISVSVLQEVYFTLQESACHQVNVSVTMTAHQQLLATMADVRTHVRFQDLVEQMPSVSQSTTSPNAHVLPEPKAIPMSGVLS